MFQFCMESVHNGTRSIAKSHTDIFVLCVPKIVDRQLLSVREQRCCLGPFVDGFVVRQKALFFRAAQTYQIFVPLKDTNTRRYHALDFPYNHRHRQHHKRKQRTSLPIFKCAGGAHCPFPKQQRTDICPFFDEFVAKVHKQNENMTRCTTFVFGR